MSSETSWVSKVCCTASKRHLEQSIQVVRSFYTSVLEPLLVSGTSVLFTVCVVRICMLHPGTTGTAGEVKSVRFGSAKHRMRETSLVT